MEILGERPAWAMSDSEKLSALDAVIAERARLKVVELQLTAELERNRHAQEIGAGDTARLLAHRYRVDLPTARRTVRLAVALSKHPATAAALPDPASPFPDPATATPTSAPDTADAATSADAPETAAPETAAPGADRQSAGSDGSSVGSAGWRVHPDQAEAIVSVLAKIPTTVPIENVEFAESRLIELAATHTPSELRAAGKKIRDVLDPDGPEPDEKLAYARESLTWKNADQGVTFRGYLACENAELFRTLIHAGARPHRTVNGELDPRPRDKRQADALTGVLNAAVSAGADTATTTRATADLRNRAELDASVHGTDAGGVAGPEQDPLPDIEGGTDPVTDPRGTDPGAGFVAGHGPKAHISVTIDFGDLRRAVANATGDLVFGDTLSAATIRRLACDAEILPIILGSKSQPLDVGTSQRLVTRPMRRALNARDKGCVVCGAPPVQCEAHHLEHWIDGGITAVSNLVLLCKRHHLDLHSGHWHIRIIADAVEVTRPTWANPNRIQPGRYRPPLLPDPPPAVPDHTAKRPPPAADVPRPNPWAEDRDTDLPPGSSTAGESNLPSGADTPFDPWGDGPAASDSAA